MLASPVSASSLWHGLWVVVGEGPCCGRVLGFSDPPVLLKFWWLGPLCLDLASSASLMVALGASPLRHPLPGTLPTHCALWQAQGGLHGCWVGVHWRFSSLHLGVKGTSGSYPQAIGASLAKRAKHRGPPVYLHQDTKFTFRWQPHLVRDRLSLLPDFWLALGVEVPTPSGSPTLLNPPPFLWASVQRWGIGHNADHFACLCPCLLLFPSLIL